MTAHFGNRPRTATGNYRYCRITLRGGAICRLISAIRCFGDRATKLRPTQTLAVRKRSPEKLKARQITARKSRMPKHRMRGMKQSVPKSVDEYIAAQPEEVRPKLEHVSAGPKSA